MPASETSAVCDTYSAKATVMTNVIVVINRQCHTPGAHRAGWVEFKSASKGSRRLIVIEHPEKSHTLIEKDLRVRGVRADPSVKGPDAVIELRSLRPIIQGRGQMIAHGHCAAGIRQRLQHPRW
jgi:hypothetical protein